MKLKEKIYNLFSRLKKSIERFPLTIVAILVLTVIYAINLDNDLIKPKDLGNITLFIIIFANSSFFIETILEDKIKTRIIYYLISALFASIYTFALNIEEGLLGMTNEVFISRVNRFLIAYLITIIILAIYYNYKKSNKTFEEYVTKTFVSIFKTSLIYGILAIGIAIITAIFVYLILDSKSYMLVARMEILLFGIYYIPTLLYSLYNKEDETGKFAKIVIKYVLGTLVMSAFIIIYLYIIKIIILRDMPSNQIFRILSALFIIGMPIWTMILSFKEDGMFDKINRKLPILFIPFIILQIYSIAIRIQANGITELRYLCLMLIIFEIIYTIIYIKNKEKISRILFAFIILTIISTIMPFTNMFSISNISQYNNLKIYKQKSEYTDIDKTKIYGAYYYLKYSVDGKKYIDKCLTEEDIENIKEFNTKANNRKYEKNIYASKKFDFIDVEGYKKLYNINSYSYKNDNKGTINEIFSNISFDIEENNDNININMMPLINEYLNNEQDLNNYFKEKNELEIDNKKVILKSISIQYDDETKNVNSYNISGYLLEK